MYVIVLRVCIAILVHHYREHRFISLVTYVSTQCARSNNITNRLTITPVCCNLLYVNVSATSAVMVI